MVAVEIISICRTYLVVDVNKFSAETVHAFLRYTVLKMASHYTEFCSSLRKNSKKNEQFNIIRIG